MQSRNRAKIRQNAERCENHEVRGYESRKNNKSE